MKHHTLHIVSCAAYSSLLLVLVHVLFCLCAFLCAQLKPTGSNTEPAGCIREIPIHWCPSSGLRWSMGKMNEAASCNRLFLCVCLTSDLWLTGCVTRDVPTTQQQPPSSCRPCGTELIQATTSPSSPASSSRWLLERWAVPLTVSC